MSEDNRTVLEKIAESFGLTFEILAQLFDLIAEVRKHGYGRVTITIKKGQVYNLSYTVEGEPNTVSDHKKNSL